MVCYHFLNRSDIFLNVSIERDNLNFLNWGAKNWSGMYYFTISERRRMISLMISLRRALPTLPPTLIATFLRELVVSVIKYKDFL